MKAFRLIPFFALVLLGMNTFSQSPVIVDEPSSKIICTGSSVVFVVEATGSEPLSYEWFLDDTSIGNNNDTLSIASVSEADEGSYHCIVSNGEGSAQTNDFQLTVISDAPEITGSSGGGSHCEGAYLQIQVTTTGEALSYSWTKDGEPIPEFGPLVTINSLSPDDAGTYQCIATNACGSDSADIILETLEEPGIISPPESLTVCEGEEAEFSVLAAGTDVSYQWYFDDSPLDGATSSELIIPNIQQENSGMIRCVISNACGADTSGQVSLNVNTTAQITAHPSSGDYCLGEEITLLSTATGTQPIARQWYLNDSPVSDSTESTLTVTTQPGDTAYYYAAYMNTCGTAYSDSAVISTNMPPAITEQPEPQTVCLHDTLELTIKANGFQPMYFQWQRAGADIDDDNASGVNTANLTIENINEGQSGLYSCIAWNDCGEAFSDTVEVEIILPPDIVSQPDALTVCEGEDASMEMIIQGNQPFDFLWIHDESSDTVSTAEVLSLSDIQASDAGNYFCTVSNQCADVTSNAAELEVLTYPEFTTQPVETDACHGDSIALEVQTGGTGPINLMWFKNQSALTSETDSLLEFDPAETLETGYYMCVADNICGITESDEVLVNIGTAPSITWNPVGYDLCENETLELLADAQGENVFYQWYVNDQPIPGQNDTSLFMPYVNDSLSGDFYFQAYNGCATVNSDTVAVNIAPAPEIDIGEDTELCDGDELTLSADGDIQSYSWNNGESTSATFTVTETGQHSLAAVGENGCTGYDTVSVIFHPYHYVNLPADGSYCGPQTLDAEEGAYSYSWNTGSTSSSIEVSESGQYYVTTEGDAFGCQYSDTVNLTILEQPEVDLGQDQSISVDSTLEICSPGEYFMYNWSNGSTDSCAIYSGSFFGPGTHDVWLTVGLENGCTDTDSIQLTVESGDAVEQLMAGEYLTLYPNPAESQINLEYKLNETAKSAKIINLNGQTIFHTALNSSSNIRGIDLSRLPAGVYILRLSTSQRQLNFKFIKQ